MTTVRCPDCAEELPVPAGTRSGDVIDCPNCAGHSFRLREEAESWTATIAHTVSCPNCEQVLLLAETAKAGDGIECCGQRYRLTFEYGAFALEA